MIRSASGSSKNFLLFQQKHKSTKNEILNCTFDSTVPGEGIARFVATCGKRDLLNNCVTFRVFQLTCATSATRRSTSIVSTLRQLLATTRL